jgi:predicted nucleic acid-binding protein
LIPVQVLGELYRVLTGKVKRSPRKARAAVHAWGDSYPLIESSPSVLLAALDLAAEHQLHVWDAIILAAAADAGCRLLLSEDLQEGFSWRGVTVTNPFSKPRHLLLDALLNKS